MLARRTLHRDPNNAQLETKIAGTQVGKAIQKEDSGHKKTRRKAGMEDCYLFFKYTRIITYVSSLPTPLLDLKVPKAPDNLLPNMTL